MTNVRMLGQISGTRDGEPWPAPGDTIDLPEDEARDLMATGIAASADEVPMVAELGEIQTRTDSSTGIPVGGMVWNNELHATDADLVRRPDANSDTVVNVGTASEKVINAREDTRQAMENAVAPSRSKSKTMTTNSLNAGNKSTSTEPVAPQPTTDTTDTRRDTDTADTTTTSTPKAGRNR